MFGELCTKLSDLNQSALQFHAIYKDNLIHAYMCQYTIIRSNDSL